MVLGLIDALSYVAVTLPVPFVAHVPLFKVTVKLVVLIVYFAQLLVLVL